MSNIFTPETEAFLNEQGENPAEIEAQLLEAFESHNIAKSELPDWLKRGAICHYKYKKKKIENCTITGGPFTFKGGTYFFIDKKKGFININRLSNAVPGWIKKGARCHYHGIIGGPIDIRDCKITEAPWVMCDTPVVLIDKKSGAVAITALSKAPPL